MKSLRDLRSARRWVRRRLSNVAKRMRLARSPVLDGLNAKGREELGYWNRRRRSEHRLRNSWYRFFYTDHFGLQEAFFEGKRMLDIGCGPRGSIEWARLAAFRLGIDPLAHRYVGLGTRRHKMRYIASIGEHMPLANDSFHIISSFNSLDHVDRLRDVVREIIRVLMPGGYFLLIVDINHDPTDSEPLRLPWSIVDELAPPLELVQQRHFERAGGGVYQSILEGGPYDHVAGSDRRGTLSAMFKKPLGDSEQSAFDEITRLKRGLEDGRVPQTKR